MPLIRVQAACELYGYGEKHLHVLASSNKSRGIPSPWYIKKGDTVWIDTELYEKNNNMQLNAQEYNMTYLYWLCMQLFGTESNLANYMAEKSTKFTVDTSWVCFFQYNLWYQSRSINSAMRYTMQLDFFVLATKLIYTKIKEGYVFIDEWK